MDNLIKDKIELIKILETVCNDKITLFNLTNDIMNLNLNEFKLLLHKIDIALITI
tara:strand:+ start:548 stop:712 length:165 start_codon:yes stop_codon:yes gene_type:complete